ncbi:hypothetical protein LCGC14_0383420 [marine sediment metagenome]|uniref:Uncharacterized protein n=1 Tax=marine sediment metagenome TaxID=412755 RepID=A0A0F9WAL3_9ZZZZ
MNEVRIVTDRHFVAPLTDEEYKDVKRKALEANLKVKQWIQSAILDKLNKEE